MHFYEDKKYQNYKNSVILDFTSVEYSIDEASSRRLIKLVKNQQFFDLLTKNLNLFEKLKAILRPLSISKDFNERFTKENKLGSGSFATVYKGSLEKLDSKYALKMYDMPKLASPGEKFSIDILMNEIRILRLVSNAKNIVKLYEVHETKNEIIIIMDLAEGGELLNRFNGPRSSGLP